MGTIGHDSLYGYDPVWRRCEELGVAPTFHAPALGWGTHTSTKSFMFNHLGHFAQAGEASCGAIVMGAVATCFPNLRFAFEGGVSWACSLYADLLGHYEVRNLDAISNYDPQMIDWDLLTACVEQYGQPAVRERGDRVGDGLRFLSDPDEPRDLIDELAESRIRDAADIEEMFSKQFFFGCEADDPLNPLAFDRTINPRRHPAARVLRLRHRPLGRRRHARALHEACELVEDGRLDRAAFERYVFSNAADLLTAKKPELFQGTVLEKQVEVAPRT